MMRFFGISPGTLPGISGSRGMTSGRASGIRPGSYDSPDCEKSDDAIFYSGSFPA